MRLCCGDEGAKKLLDLHHKRCKLFLKIQAAAFGKPCGAVAFGENARAFTELLERLGYVEHLGGVMHPSCWQLLQCNIAARLAQGKPVPCGLDREKHFLGADEAFGAVIKHAGAKLLKPVDYWVNLWAGKAEALEAVKKAWRDWVKKAWEKDGVLRKSMEDGALRAALERWWALQRDRATERFDALVAADIAKGNDQCGNQSTSAIGRGTLTQRSILTQVARATGGSATRSAGARAASSASACTTVAGRCSSRSTESGSTSAGATRRRTRRAD